eukprot:364354-Chlamydomonas_euryale.AAC.18
MVLVGSSCAWVGAWKGRAGALCARMRVWMGVCIPWHKRGRTNVWGQVWIIVRVGGYVGGEVCICRAQVLRALDTTEEGPSVWEQGRGGRARPVTSKPSEWPSVWQQGRGGRPKPVTSKPSEWPSVWQQGRG